MFFNRFTVFKVSMIQLDTVSVPSKFGTGLTFFFFNSDPNAVYLKRIQNSSLVKTKFWGATESFPRRARNRNDFVLTQSR